MNSVFPTLRAYCSIQYPQRRGSHESCTRYFPPWWEYHWLILSFWTMRCVLDLCAMDLSIVKSNEISNYNFICDWRWKYPLYVVYVLLIWTHERGRNIYIYESCIRCDLFACSKWKIYLREHEVIQTNVLDSCPFHVVKASQHVSVPNLSLLVHAWSRDCLFDIPTRCLHFQMPNKVVYVIWRGNLFSFKFPEYSLIRRKKVVCLVVSLLHS
jgi:hypothetical protein